MIAESGFAVTGSGKAELSDATLWLLDPATLWRRASLRPSPHPRFGWAGGGPSGRLALRVADVGAERFEGTRLERWCRDESAPGECLDVGAILR